MEQDVLIKNIKREVLRAIMERSQSFDLQKLGSPKEEDAIHYDNVEEKLNIPYINRAEVPLAMDIFQPITEKGTELPVIITIHSGGFSMGDRRICRPFNRLLANKGYLVFSLEYRLAPKADISMELDDISAGLDLIGRSLPDYDVDFTRVFLVSDCTGAFLATYVTAMKGSEKVREAIGYDATRFSFKALGFTSGMFYTNRDDLNGWLLSDQIYGKKRNDENFLQYMNPENSEIINNLPPVFLITSKADFLNYYTIRMYEALKNAGKVSRLLYYGDDELQHAFTSSQTYEPRSIEAIDKMLAWFEEQADIQRNSKKTTQELERKKKRLLKSMADGSFDNRKLWQYIQDRTAVDPGRLYAPAIIDCSRTYTYAQMFDRWDRYARVFSALGMTGSNKSRVAIAGTISAEPIFAYYALNMTGASVSMFSYPDLLPGGRWKTMVQKEHITDLVISDIMVTPEMWNEIRSVKLEAGLKNVILLHTLMGGPSIGYSEMLFNEFNFHALKRLPDVQYIDDLIVKYSDTPIQYGKKGSDEIAVICHTSGTSNGTRKPLPYTDRMVNALASAAPTGFLPCTATQLKSGDGNDSPGAVPGETQRIRNIIPYDFSSCSSINGFIHTVFSGGQTAVMTFFGFLHPKFVRALKYYSIGTLITSGFMVDKWMELPDLDADSFASLKVIAFGGSYLSPTKMEKYEEFLKAHGFRGVIFQGYGMSEVAGAYFVLPPDCKGDCIGYPSNIEDFRLYDEEEGRFCRLDEGEREGVLYGRSNSMCLNILDGETLFELTEIDGRNYLCMNDVVHVNPDGTLSYVGRSNQYFVNNEGVKFDSGLAETQIAAHPNVKMCAIVPVLDKRIHDTVPVLYVVPQSKERNAAEQIREVLIDAYIKGEKLKNTILPTQFVAVDKIPVNANGKVDCYHITRSRLTGVAYNILPVKKDGVLTDIRYEKAEQLTSYTGGTLPEGMGTDSAFGIFDMFCSTPEFMKLASIPKHLAAQEKAAKDKIKTAGNSIVSNIRLPIPEIPRNSHGTLMLSKLPEPAQTFLNLFEILLRNKDFTDHDYEE